VPFGEADFSQAPTEMDPLLRVEAGQGPETASFQRPPQPAGPVMTKPAQGGLATNGTTSDSGVRPLQHRVNGTGTVQRGKGDRFGKAQVMGMNKTVNPFFGWKGFYKSMKDIVKGKDADVKYGSRP